MGIILDTSILIAAEKGTINFSKYENYGDVYISAITITELLVGVYRANTEKRRIKRSVFVEYIIKSITSLPFTEHEARVHAQILSKLLEKANNIGAHDLIIASTAIGNNHSLLTMEVEDFKRVPGLDILNN